jgi:hypothetical protein
MSVQMSVANRYTRRRVQPDLWVSLVHLGTPSLENIITQGNKMQQLLRIGDV